jgi:chromosome segregation ATPase
MFRKLGITAIAVVAGLFILNSTHFGSYARTAWHKVKAQAKGQVPLEFQLETIRNEAAQLTPDIRKNLSLIAAETVAVDNLKEQIAVVQAELDKKTENIRTMRNDLKSDTKVVYNGQVIGKDRLAAILGRSLEAAKQCRQSLEAKRGLLEAKEAGLQAAKEQLESMRMQRETMETEIARIEAEMKTLRLAQTRSDFRLDDSRLARIKEALQDVRNQLKVQQTEANLLAQWSDDLSLAKPKSKNATQVSREADEFLGGSSEEGTVATKSPKE